MPVNKPKFEFICRADGGTNKVFLLKNVSSLFVSNIQFESFEIVFHDGYVENINCLEMRLPSSLAPNESYEFICQHHALINRPVGTALVRFTFTAEDELYSSYRFVAQKDAKDTRFEYLKGIWPISVEVINADHIVHRSGKLAEKVLEDAENMLAKRPVVFISYSWTSEEYKKTVLEFATELRSKGVDVILDQWDLKPGQDRFAFMEKSIRKADKVLILCDQGYVKKADDRSGGVGAETSIITPDVYNKYDQQKFIPIVMEAFDVVPEYLRSRYAIDNTSNDNRSFEEILHIIFDKPAIEKPPIGQPPEWVCNSDAKYTPDDNDRTVSLVEQLEHSILSCIGSNRLSLAEIAGQVGLSQASVKKAMTKLEEQGLVVKAGKGFIRKQNPIEDKKPIRVCIKVWQNIIDPTSGRVHDSTGLVALDGIRYGPVHEVTEITSSLDAELLAEFVRLNPNYRFDRHELHTDEEDI